MAKANFGFKAADGRVTSMTVNTETVDATSLPVIATAASALEAALEAIVESNSNQTVLTTIVDGNGYDPAGAAGVRGDKAIIRWYAANEGPAGQFGSNEIGCADRAAFTLSGGRFLLQGAAYTALKTAFDALAQTENGNTVDVYEVEYVTRTI